jgi:hypothetical protein
MHRLALLGLAGLFWCLAQSLAFAAAPTGPGTAVGVDPSADDTFGTSSRTLVVGADVSVGDTVVTGATGQVQLLFQDQTRLAVGPNSSLLIEAYLLKDDATVGQFTINALSGTFRFITGTSAKSAYQIKTSMGMIGVRGTAFDFISDPKIGSTILLFHGAINTCNLDAKCVDLTQTCGVASVTGGGSKLVDRAGQLHDNLRARFQWVQSDAKLKTDFRVDQAKGCLAPATIVAPVVKATPKPTLKPKPRLPVHRPPGTTTYNEPPPDMVLPLTSTPDYPVYQPPRHKPPVITCPVGTITVKRGGRIICLPRRVIDPGTGTLSTPPFNIDQPPRNSDGYLQ